jgi:hypothetical protein
MESSVAARRRAWLSPWGRLNRLLDWKLDRLRIPYIMLHMMLRRALANAGSVETIPCRFLKKHSKKIK